MLQWKVRWNPAFVFWQEITLFDYVRSEPFHQANSKQAVLGRGYYCSQAAATVMKVMRMFIMVACN